jgi:murein DD-endopeptidase MepM/ murein hydrolase activator NlpD
MHWRMFSLAAAICLGSIAAAQGCDLPGVAGDKPPIATRRPLQGEDVRLTSGFGVRFHPLLNHRQLHTGVDWAAPTGTPVTAAAAGRVLSAERGEGGLGIMVVVDHGGGWHTAYAHLARFTVTEGDCLKAGDVLGAVGATGLTGGPALHFEVRREGTPVDPLALPIDQ